MNKQELSELTTNQLIKELIERDQHWGVHNILAEMMNFKTLNYSNINPTQEDRTAISGFYCGIADSVDRPETKERLIELLENIKKSNVHPVMLDTLNVFERCAEITRPVVDETASVQN